VQHDTNISSRQQVKQGQELSSCFNSSSSSSLFVRRQFVEDKSQMESLWEDTKGSSSALESTPVTENLLAPKAPVDITADSQHTGAPLAVRPSHHAHQLSRQAVSFRVVWCHAVWCHVLWAQQPPPLPLTCVDGPSNECVPLLLQHRL